MDELLTLARSRFGESGPLVSATAEPNGFATKSASSFVKLDFGRTQCELFVKRADHAISSRRPDPPDVEARLYEALHEDEAFAAPDFVGLIKGAEPYLVLGRVPGWDLRYQDLELWKEAAAALGRMHASYAERVRDSEFLAFLPRLDRDRALVEAQSAFAVVRRRYPQAVAALAEVADGYEDVAAELEREPWTLVHGDLAPKNALIDDTKDPPSALFVDWEWAAVGPGLMDVADLVNGLDPSTMETMLHGYVEGARGSAVPEADADIERSVHLAFLHRTIFRLGRSFDWEVDPDLVARWAEEAAVHYAEL